MKIIAIIASILLSVSLVATAFRPSARSSQLVVGILKMGYAPDGMSKEEYQKLRAKEKEAEAKKKYGAFGVTTFKSRSLQAFQSDLESGKANHLLPVFDAKGKLQRGEIKQSDIPYMQRLGSWDDTDVGGKKKGNAMDQKYNNAVKPSGLDWTGQNPQRNMINRNNNKKVTDTNSEKPKKKGLFGGLF